MPNYKRARCMPLPSIHPTNREIGGKNSGALEGGTQDEFSTALIRFHLDFLRNIAALQLAKSMNAGHIAAVCSGRNTELVKSHGADEVIDYTQHNVVNYFRGNSKNGEIEEADKFDVIYDAASGSGAGEDYKPCSAQLLCKDDDVGERSHGQYVAINGGIGLWLRQFTIGQKKNEHLLLTNTNTADLNILSNLADNGWSDPKGGHNKISPIVAHLFSFCEENVEKGFELLKSRRVVGKVVFDMTNENDKS